MTLFGDDESPSRSAGKPRRAVFARYRPRTRQQCGDCMTAIHKKVQRAPEPVRWRALIGAATHLLCERHKNLREEQV